MAPADLASGVGRLVDDPVPRHDDSSVFCPLCFLYAYLACGGVERDEVDAQGTKHLPVIQSVSTERDRPYLPLDFPIPFHFLHYNVLYVLQRFG